jgi:hypothetical protein
MPVCIIAPVNLNLINESFLILNVIHAVKVISDF